MSYLKAHDEHVAEPGTVFSFGVVYLSSYLGTLQIGVCDQCPFMAVQCTHEHNEWNEEGTVLTCNLCGADGT